MSGRWRSLQAIRCRPSRVNYRVTAFSHNVRMSERYPLALRQADQARTDFATIESDLQFLMGQLARVPTRKEQARNALGIIFATAMLTTVAVLLFIGFWRYCLLRGPARSSSWSSLLSFRAPSQRESTDPER